jgi:serine/threonine-protein kinase
VTGEYEGLAAALADRYRLERELGRGGFAIVYLAHDVRHDRPVALKVLHPEIASSLGTERFEREIRLAARLQHPHILTVHDSGVANGQLWFAMPFIEGESLRDRLVRERQLPLNDALRIARETADALDYAHRHGVVHRDIKPENILLAESHALVADFGIARALSGEKSLTQTGMSIGTPAYMSPEQAAGDASLDARSDIYSLGAVLYEMLAGEPPFTGPTPQAVIARMLTESPRPLHPSRPVIPAAVDDVIARAMAHVPADRFASAAEMAAALPVLTGPGMPASSAVVPVAPPARTRARWRPSPLLAVFALGLLLGLGALFAWRRGAGVDAGVRRLAVLPFENQGAADDDYFAAGITDEIRGKLSAVPGLQVTARSSAIQYKGTTKTPEQIGRELGVEYLLTGTVRWEGSGAARRVRVSPELIAVATNSTKWQQAFDTTLSDVFQVQAGIASRVAQELDIALGASAQQRLATKPTDNVAAYDAYLRGEEATQSLGTTDAVPLRKGLAYYEQAVALDSSFVEAWAQLSRTVCSLNASAPTVAGVERCREAADRALALAPDRPEGHLAKGVYLRTIRKDFAASLVEFAAGLHVAPNHAALLTASASSERSLGRWADGLRHLEQAKRLDPRSINTARGLAYAYHEQHRYAEAVAEYDRAMLLAPTNLALVQGKTAAYLGQGDLAGARAVIAAALQHLDTTAIVARFAIYQEMMWVLPDELRPRVTRLRLSDFDSDRGMWALKVGATYRLMGDSARARAYGDSSRVAFEEALRPFPDDAQLTELHGRALVLAGLKADAVREGEKSLRLRETSLDAVTGPYYKYQVARILIQAGQLERALDLIEPLLKVPGDLTPGWLNIDPIFAPLRGNPRFERLLHPVR